jgi:cytoskeletal protein RodZ
MYRKLIITGAAAAAIVGSGTAALAVTGPSPSPTPASSSTRSTGHPSGTATSGTATSGTGTSDRHQDRRAAARAFLTHAVRAQVVTKGKDGTFVTHDYARGMVKAVSPTLLVVHTADGTDESFSVGTGTKVRVRTAGKGSAGSIGDVHPGDTVVVAGTGTGTPVAAHVLDVGKK